MADDFTLLDAWGEGDRKAADELIGRHFDTLYRFFASKVSDGVEDLVQDTLLACIDAPQRFRRDSSFRAFLLGVARFTLFRRLRKRRPELSDIGESSIAVLDPSPSSIVARHEEERLLLEALRILPLDHQIAIELYEWENLTGPEIAEVLGITEAAFRSRLHRARNELNKQLERLARGGKVLESTMADLPGWAASLRRLLGR